MSEHRPPRYDFVALARLAKQACHDWPDCRCGAQWPHWDAALEEWIDPAKPPATEDELAIALDAITCMLACVTEHCPDRAIRMAAKMQLVQPMCAAVVAGAEPKAVLAALRAKAQGAAQGESAANGESLSHGYQPPLDRGPFGMWAKGEEAKRIGEIVERRNAIRTAKSRETSDERK